jgi:two-component system, chemotaxis family, response regulator Rcp1
MAARAMHILLVEDNPGDVRLTMEALHETATPSALHVARDGAEALDYLHHADAGRPDLILLDLNLPRKDGREVLTAIRNDPALACIPVVILTSSAADSDILGSYRLQANCYVIKPLDVDVFIEAVKAIEVFWLTVVTLPPRMGGAWTSG